jgi:hypothetical protein
MTIEMDSMANKFDHNHWMVSKMDSIITIKINHRPGMETERGENDKPLLLVSFDHKDGQLFKLWSPPNHHNFLDGDQSFSIAKKVKHATCF